MLTELPQRARTAAVAWLRTCHFQGVTQCSRQYVISNINIRATADHINSQPAPSTCTYPCHFPGLRSGGANYKDVYSVSFVKYCVHSGHYTTREITGLLV